MNQRLLIMTAALWLAGCAVGPDYQQPDLVLPEEWPERVQLSDEDREDWSGWWQRFNDPHLDRLVQRALADNLDIRLQLQRLQESRARLGLADAERMPTLSAQAEAAREREPLAASPVEGFGGGVDNRFSVMGMLSYEVDLWGRAASDSRAARAALDESLFSHDAVRLNIITEVVSTYMDLRGAQQSLNITERTLASREESVGIEEIRYEEGETDELIFRQAQSELLTTRALLPQQRQRVAQLESALAILAGMSPRELMSDLDFGTMALTDIQLPDSVPAVLPSELLQRRPDIRSAEAGIMLATANIGSAQAARLPSLNLSAFTGSSARDTSDLFSSEAETWGIGASVMGPIFDFGRNKARVQTAEALQAQAETRFQVTVNEAFREVRDALTLVESTSEQVVRVREQVETLEGTLELAQLRYDAGLTNFLAVQDTQRVLLNAELTLTEALRDRLIATATLFKAMGGGWQEDVEDDGGMVEPAG
ncbi:MAG: efflux transporter outer membrane subunit [Halomonadaceae bacterium]|nr:MAG: efflux transporter outer membrane subunit [Halomonadaceae bacterium]